MNQVFLAPASSSRLFENFQKTVEKGFEINDFLTIGSSSHYSKKTKAGRSGYVIRSNKRLLYS